MKVVNGLLDTSLVTPKDNVTAVLTSGQGPLTLNEVKLIAAKLDEYIKFKNPVIEVIDATLFRLAIKGLNDYALSKLSPDLQEIFVEIFREVFLNEGV